MAKCKSCGGNNAKKLSLIEKEGSVSGDFRGVGLGTGGVGVGGGKTSAKSKLAAQASYKEKESALENLVIYGSVAIICIFGFFLDEWWLGIKIGFGGMLIFAFLKAFGVVDKTGSADQAQARLNWEKTWMCTDCGYKWIK